jgi:hypothetical protein
MSCLVGKGDEDLDWASTGRGLPTSDYADVAGGLGERMSDCAGCCAGRDDEIK